MYIISKNLRKHWINYVWQSAAAEIVMAGAIYIFSGIVGLFILAGVALRLAMSTNLEMIINGSGFAISGAILSALVRYFLKPWLRNLF